MFQFCKKIPKITNQALQKSSYATGDIHGGFRKAQFDKNHVELALEDENGNLRIQGQLIHNEKNPKIGNIDFKGKNNSQHLWKQNPVITCKKDDFIFLPHITAYLEKNRNSLDGLIEKIKPIPAITPSLSSQSNFGSDYSKDSNPTSNITPTQISSIQNEKNYEQH